ncbi:MAG: ABC transporter ATP-binding protein, partial [Magnetococcales bacterium]|nr:ABC transporter ATP-binding protein [Magnetococcales bacterium]
MALIRLQNVSVDLPVYDASHRSLRRAAAGWV